MKIAALVIVIFGLLTALYGVAAVVPKYREANDAWLTTKHESPRYQALESKRDDLRARCQSYAMVVIGTAAVAFVLALIGRKRPSPPTALIIVGSVVCFALFGVMQLWGNIF